MLINWINVTVYAEYWPKLHNLISQAERAINEVIERDNVTSTGSTSSGMPSQYNLQQATAQKSSKSQRDLVLSAKAKIMAVSGLVNLQEKHYRAAAEKFMMVCSLTTIHLINHSFFRWIWMCLTTPNCFLPPMLPFMAQFAHCQLSAVLKWRRKFLARNSSGSHWNPSPNWSNCSKNSARVSSVHVLTFSTICAIK